MQEGSFVAIGLALAGSLAATACQAQSAPFSGSANAIIENRRDVNATALQRKAESEAQGLQRAEEEEPPRTLSVGFGYGKGGNGSRSTTVPVAFDYSIGAWYLAAGGGVGSARSESGHALGWSDVTVGASYTFTASDPRWQLTPTLAVLIPSRGEVGSRRSVQAADLEVSFKKSDAWKLYADVSVAYDNDSVEGVSRYTRGASLKAKRSWTEDTNGSVSLQRSLTGGKRGSTSSALDLNFPISGPLGGYLLLSRTWTSGQRSTGLEFDLSCAF